MIRHPVVSGQFYPSSRAELDRTVRNLTREDGEKVRAVGVVVPHAGYVYSGAVAGEVFSRVEVPGRHVILCPNHTGLGARLLKACPLLSDDDAAHAREHSLEVVLPFIHRFRPDFAIVPIALARLSLGQCRDLGTAIAAVLSGEDPRPLIVASSDMTHYEPDKVAREQDKKAISRIEELDPEGLFGVVRDERISMCGVVPATVMLFAARELGASGARLIRYATSGDASGDFDQVVGYAGVAAV
jgi:predicted class III extradiol MEMO1 family dioxygenase